MHTTDLGISYLSPCSSTSLAIFLPLFIDLPFFSLKILVYSSIYSWLYSLSPPWNSGDLIQQGFNCHQHADKSNLSFKSWPLFGLQISSVISIWNPNTWLKLNISKLRYLIPIYLSPGWQCSLLQNMVPFSTQLLNQYFRLPPFPSYTKSIRNTYYLHRSDKFPNTHISMLHMTVRWLEYHHLSPWTKQ